MQRESSRLEAAIEIQNLLATAPTNSNLTSLSNQERRRLRRRHDAITGWKMEWTRTKQCATISAAGNNGGHRWWWWHGVTRRRRRAGGRRPRRCP
uniref:Uncharacterized protein n=1 Tax=Arundo donax TaxID=35708 RepID=A0A0A9DR50_ARUDO